MPSVRYYIPTTALLVAILSACGSETDKGGQAANGGSGNAVGGGMSTGGGSAVTGGRSAVGGAGVGSGGLPASGGSGALGGAGATGGRVETGTGGAGTGGAGTGGASTGGATGAGGTSKGGAGMGGATGTGGATGPVGPCDIYQTAGTPCVAAHATVRALYAAYSGPLYQLQRASDKAVKDVPVGDGGFADTTVQDSFCAGTTCTIPIIYDQSGNNNHLRVTWWAYWMRNGGKPADANGQKIKVGGHTVYGIKVTANSSNVGYRTGVQLEGKASITKGSTTVTFTTPQTLPANTPLYFRVNTEDCPPDSFPNNCKFLAQWTATAITNATTVTLKSPYTGTSSTSTDVWDNTTKGVAVGNEAEALYMVVDGRRYSKDCCFGYGNSEMSGWDEGNGTMECVYFGSDVTWGGKGEGNGPWIAADLENGMYKCDKGGWGSDSLQVPSAKSINADYATAMVKGPAANHFTLKAGNAQSGTLVTMWDGARPSASGYNPKSLRGAVILGTGGDGSPGGTGTWFEGVVTKGSPPDAVDDLIQANIVAVGYGR